MTPLSKATSPHSKRPFLVALTGGIGSGKSTVAQLFAERGIVVVDADEIAREVVAPQTTALQQITEQFGAAILNSDGTLNRTALRNIVFAQQDKRRWLNQLLHPLIAELTRQRIAQARSPYVIWAVPLLLENGLQQQADRILVVDLPESRQRQRAAQRDLATATSIEQIMAAQVSRTARLAAADDVIDNSTTPDALNAQVALLHPHYLDLAAQ